jgi:tetratricopeptide (TPR) repeat protein
MALSVGHGLTLAYCLGTGLIDALMQMGDYQKAEYAIDLLERTIDRHGLGAWVAKAMCYRAAFEVFSERSRDPERLRLAFDGLGGKAANVEHQAYFAILAGAMLEAAHIDDVLEVSDFIITLGTQRWARPEFMRIKAGTERAKGQIDRAEATLRASLQDADEIEAPSFKFRAAYDLASLLHERGASIEARELIAPLYNRFSDGFDTRDLRRARGLLKQLD